MRPTNQELINACIELTVICERKQHEHDRAKVLFLSNLDFPEEKVNQMELLQMTVGRLQFDFKWMSYRTAEPEAALINLHTTSYDLIIVSMKDVSSDFLKQEQERLMVPIFNLI